MTLAEFCKFIAEKYKEEIGPYRPEIIKALDDPLIPDAMRVRLKEMAKINRDFWTLVEFKKAPLETPGTPHQRMERFLKVADALRKDLNLPESQPAESP